jgi:D-glycero-alpha-D-manno-heptose-7-phosphate kinase
VQIASSDFRAFFRHRDDAHVMWDSDLALPQAVLRHFGVHRGYHLFLASEIPPGTGLGSSSAVAVALVKALATLTGRPMDRAEIGSLACHIEIDILGAPIGRQDQYAAAFGGLNAMRFRPDGVDVEPLAIDALVRRRLQSNLLLFFTGSSRKASAILAEQGRATRRDGEVLAALHTIRAHADAMRSALEAGDLDEVGDLLHRSWQEKRRLARGITNDRIDQLYALARRLGARGGKITGAGGGGFLLLYCDDAARARVISGMEGEGLYHMDFHFDTGGARVLVNNLSSPGLLVRVGEVDAGAFAEASGGGA